MSFPVTVSLIDLLEMKNVFFFCPNIIEGFWIILKSYVHVSLPLLLSIPAGLHPNNSCLLQSTPFSRAPLLLSLLENIAKGTRDPNHCIPSKNIARIAKAALHKFTWKVKSKCQICPSCLSFLTCLS